MEEYLDKHIRVSTRTKYRLDEVKKNLSYNAYIAEMLDYFEVTYTSPHNKVKNPTARVEKRIEDLIKIVKSQEKDIFRPLLEKSEGAKTSAVANEHLVRLANENKQLKEEIKKYQTSSGDVDYKHKLESLIDLIKILCNKSQFRKSTFGADLQVPESFFDKLIEKIDREYVL